MESLSFPEAHVVDIESCDEPNFRCRFGRIQNSSDRRLPYRVIAMVQVPEGVRYWSARVPSQPMFPYVRNACLNHGELGYRPYVMLQDRDSCSRVCALALLHDYCMAHTIDPQKVVLRAYPYDFIAPKLWDPDRWGRILEEARWQGLIFPREWNADRLIELLLTLHNHDLRSLLDALLMEIATARGMET